jgi:hypothetical protein
MIYDLNLILRGPPSWAAVSKDEVVDFFTYSTGRVG